MLTLSLFWWPFAVISARVSYRVPCKDLNVNIEMQTQNPCEIKIYIYVLLFPKQVFIFAETM